jgi:hypothetical protein
MGTKLIKRLQDNAGLTFKIENWWSKKISKNGMII